MKKITTNLKILIGTFLILPVALLALPRSIGAETTNNNGNGATRQETTQSNQRFDEVLAEQDDLTIFRAISKAGNLEDTLSRGGPYTLFIPSDEALKKLPRDVVVRFSENRNYIEDTLRNHIVPSAITTEDIDRGSIENELGNNLPIERSSDSSRVGGQRVLRSIPYDNGVIYVIDGVILP